jgi:hypothetical protein
MAVLKAVTTVVELGNWKAAKKVEQMADLSAVMKVDEKVVRMAET